MSRLSSLISRHGPTFLYFGAIQGAQLLAPLLALPWLGRVLGPEAFGLLMYMCVIPPIIALCMDWGLTLGGAREAAANRDNPAGLSSLAGAVFSAKIFLAICCLAGAAFALPFLPHAAEWPAAYFLAALLGLCRGLTPLWHYQGTGRGARELAIYDVSASLLALALVFTFIRSPQDWPLYLAFLAACKCLAYMILNIGLWRRYSPHLSLKAGIAILRRSKTLFGASLFAMLHTNASQLVLGYFLPASQMGLVLAASKMLRALASLVNPATQTIFSHVCVLRHKEPQKARNILRLSLAASFLAMCAASILVWLFAPWIIRIALGPEFPAAVPVLRIMILAAPPMACEYVLASQTLVPYGREKAQVRVQAAIAAASIPLAAGLAFFGGLEGSAFLPLCLETGLCLGFMTAVRRHCPQALFPPNSRNIAL